MPAFVWIAGAFLAAGAGVKLMGSGVEDTSNAGLKIAQAAAIGAGAYFLLKKGKVV